MTPQEIAKKLKQLNKEIKSLKNKEEIKEMQGEIKYLRSLLVGKML